MQHRSVNDAQNIALVFLHGCQRELTDRLSLWVAHWAEAAAIWGHVAPEQVPAGSQNSTMGETAEYQRLQETTESDYQRLPSDDEEVDLCSSLYFTVVGNSR